MAIQVENNSEGKNTFVVYCDGIDSRGRRIQLRRRGIKTEKEARAIEFELRRQIANQKDQLPNYTWDEWFQICMERMKLEFKPSTIMEYLGKHTNWIQTVIGEKLLDEVTPQDVHDIVYSSRTDVTWYTRRGTLRRIHRIFQMAIADGLVKNNPASRIRVKVLEARKAVLNRIQIDKLLLEAKRVRHRFYDIWVLAIMTGMRSGELYELKWTDICFDQKIIWVQRSWTSKNGVGTTKSSRYRVVPLSGELDLFLRELRLREDVAGGYVLPRLNEWTRGNQAQVLKDFCLGIGITPIKFHDLRATFITQMLANGVSLAHVMALAGHAEIKTTQGYLRLAGLELKGTTESLGISLPRLTEAKVIKMRGEVPAGKDPTSPYRQSYRF